MIDGLQITYYTSNPKSSILGLSCWEVLINEETQQKVNDIKTAKFRGLDLKLKPSFKGGFNFIVNGSFHKYHNCGIHNTDQFTFLKLLQSIDSFIDVMNIKPEKCLIHGIEIGVNIPLPYSPYKVIKNLVSYRSKPFAQINKRSAGKGSECTLSQYSIKVYDKQKISEIECGNVLRIEVSIDKMQAIDKYNICTLADLQNYKKVYPLVKVLEDAIKGIIWTDSAANLNRLNEREKKQWLFFSNPKSWQNMNKNIRNKSTKKWTILLSKYGKPPELLPMVLKVWNELFYYEDEGGKRRPFYQLIFEDEAEIKETYLPLECTVRKSPNRNKKSIIQNTGFSIKKIININSKIDNQDSPENHKCLSCGRDISNQKKGSVFCSEKIYGTIAKRCRNKNSNNRRAKKRIIARAIRQNKYLSITYTDNACFTYTDILHPNEIIVSKKMLDQIKQITVMEFKK